MLPGRRVGMRWLTVIAIALGAVCGREPMPWGARFARDVVWSAAPPSLTDAEDGGGLLDLF